MFRPVFSKRIILIFVATLIVCLTHGVTSLCGAADPISGAGEAKPSPQPKKGGEPKADSLSNPALKGGVLEGSKEGSESKASSSSKENTEPKAIPQSKESTESKTRTTEKEAKTSKPGSPTKAASKGADDSIEIIEEWSNPEDKGNRSFRFRHSGSKYVVGTNRQIDAALVNTLRKSLLKTKGETKPSLQALGITAKTIKQQKQEMMDAAMVPLLRARIKDPERYVQQPTLEIVSKVASRVREEKPARGLVTKNTIKFHGKPEIEVTSAPLYSWRVKVGSDSWTTYSFPISQQLGRLMSLADGIKADDAKQYWTSTFWQSEALWSCLITKEGNKAIDDKIQKNLNRMFPKKTESTPPTQAPSAQTPTPAQSPAPNPTPSAPVVTPAPKTH